MAETSLIRSLANLARESCDREDKISSVRQCDQTQTGRNYRGDAVQHETYLREALRLAISAIPATTIEEALVQVAECSARVDLIVDSEEKADKTERQAVERLFFSIAGVLRRVCGSSAEDLGVGYLMGDHMDPWTPVDERLVLVENKLGGAEWTRRPSIEQVADDPPISVYDGLRHVADVTRTSDGGFILALSNGIRLAGAYPSLRAAVAAARDLGRAGQ